MTAPGSYDQPGRQHDLSLPPPGLRWLQQNWSELGGHNFQWIAINDSGLVAADRELEGVIMLARERAGGDVTYLFLDRSEMIAGE